MIGAVTQRTTLSLQTLEEMWTSEQSQNDILSALTPTLTKILLRKDQNLFLDTMKFVAMLVAEVYEKVEKTTLCGFTERFLAAANTTANRYYNSHTFDQSRYLDCVSAILSVWVDCTDQQHLVIPKVTVYTRESKVHILDAILQSLHLKSQTKEKLLDQISSLSDVEIFVKYTIIGRASPKHHLHSLSEQPSEDIFRCWLLKHNITTIGSISDFLASSRSDEDLLSAMCRPFYSLPQVLSDSTEVVEDTEPEVNPDTLFYFDRGNHSESREETSKPAEDEIPEDEKMSVDDSPKPVLAPADTIVGAEATVVENKAELEEIQPCIENETQSETVAAVEEPVAEPGLTESCIKIRNRRKGRGNPPIPTPESEVIVVKCPTTRPVTPAAEKVDELNMTAPLTEETLSSLPDKPSVVRSGRRRRNSGESATSIGSAASVDSIASRTRNRARAPAPESLEVITEHEETAKALSTRKLKTPTVKGTPKAKQSTASKRGTSRKVSETIDETPQIPARKTRSRKLDV
ncbi:uncharacterized protein LOC134826201 [Bolinopsis microptera]|uniref:uncharacterized protein LOC134826201 n=1 Tax=Bolinopsis microptera TaxID=2820187 RepID=UPI00307A2BEE